MTKFLENLKIEILKHQPKVDLHNKNSKILFTLARSFDTNTQNTKQVHLICSRFNVSGGIDFQTLSERLTALGHIKNIVYIYLEDIEQNLENNDQNLDKNIPNLDLTKPRPINTLYKNITIYIVELYSLIHVYVTNSTLSDFIGENKYDKVFDTILVDTLFILEGVSWETFKLYFENNDIKISGGDKKKRDILSTVQYTLSYFLFLLDYNLQQIYQSFNIKSLSSKYKDKDITESIKTIDAKKDILYYRSLQKVLSIIINSEISKLKDKISEIDKIIQDYDDKIKTEEDLSVYTYGIVSIEEKSLVEEKKVYINRKKEFEGKIDRKKEFIKQIENNELTLSKLHTEYRLRGSEDSRRFSWRSLNSQKSKNNFQIGKRSYSTTSLEIKNNSGKDIVKKLNNNNTLKYLDRLKEIIHINNLDRRDIQAYIESDWTNFVKLNTSDERFLHSSLGKAIKYTQETISLANYSRRIKNVIPILKNSIENIEYLLITFSIVITYHQRMGYTAIANMIGNHILYSYYKSEYKKYIRQCNIEGRLNKSIDSDISNFPDWKEFKTQNNVTDKKIILLGDFFLTCFVISDIFYKEFDSELTDSEISTIKINKNYLNEIKENIIVSPFSLPMICEPEKWREGKFGGFLENKYLKNDIVLSSTSHKHKLENKKPIYNAINYFNSIQFTINKDLLNFLLNEGQYLFEKDMSDSEQIQNDITIKLAETYSDTTFYLSVNADWRGRLYPQSFFINYQGSDLSCSILQFAHGETLTEKGREYLYIYGANLHNENGISKKPYSERITWVKNNYLKIITMNSDFIKKADSKFMFAAFCLLMKNLNNDPNYKVHFPIFLDATCSGIQHLAALLKDSELASKVNLIPQSVLDKVGDIYSEVKDDINSAINEFGLKNPDFYHLSEVQLTRDILKISIMTKVYNVSIYGISEQLKSKFTSIKKGKDTIYIAPGKLNDVYLNFKEVHKIAEIIYNEIFNLFPSLKAIYKYLIDFTKLMIKLDIPMTWITPTGLKITQHYLKTKINKVSITIANKTKTLVLREFEDKMDKSKQSQAIIPNIIHSLDATHLIKIINSAITKGFKPIIAIHDCFGTHPNLFEKLEEMVKLEFIYLYTSGDFLSKFHEKNLDIIKENQYEIEKTDDDSYVIFVNNRNKREKIKIPKIPHLGLLDLTKVIESKYMIT